MKYSEIFMKLNIKYNDKINKNKFRKKKVIMTVQNWFLISKIIDLYQIYSLNSLNKQKMDKFDDEV